MTALILLAALALACAGTLSREELIARGEQIFFTETFDGNGRTCGTCHRLEANFALPPALIATLPDDDPLFVAERLPALREGFEVPDLLREFGLVLLNVDGGADGDVRPFVLRGVPHLLGLRHSVASADGPQTGWAGDGAPDDGSLRSFAKGAIPQHFTKTLAREPGRDFRRPTEEELDALEAFLLSLGRPAELALPLPLANARAAMGQEIFLDDSLGKCNICHVNAGANAKLQGRDLGNANFATGVEDLPDPRDPTGRRIPRDDGRGSPGDDTFNTTSLVESADTAPFFHDHSVQTLEGAVAFYNSTAFERSPAGRMLASFDPDGVAIRLDAVQVEAVAAFLRVVNALENIRSARELLQRADDAGGDTQDRLLLRAAADAADASSVLGAAGLHPRARGRLGVAEALAREAAESFRRGGRIDRALQELARARTELQGRS